MQSIWLEDQKLIFRDDTPIPDLKEGDALIKMRLAGVCSTDLELIKGYYPYHDILGHEFVGEVVRAPSYDDLIGKRVVGEISIYCGTCEACLKGRSSHCENRKTLGIHDHPGVFAEYLTLPVRNLHIVPDSVSDDQAVFTELLAAALEIQQQVQIHPEMKVLVVGAGRLGILIAQTLALTGCQLEVVVRREEPKRILARFGITCISTDEVEHGKYDLVVEVTGSYDGFAVSRRAVRPRGTLLLKSTFAGDVSLNLSSLVVDEISMIGSRCGPFAPALRLLESKRVDPLPLIDSRFSLSHGLEAIERAGRPGVLKVLISP
ncbi:MAG: alcohol dehydrogenase catalytic domain-containing protein [Anaerolineaceae bacterium]|nr:alcohol dehydrogenase catalytic domain-containing protein [Anaerolineaceae bacterium]